jgi:hypothetical protein
MSLLTTLRELGLPEYKVVTARSASQEQKDAATNGVFSVFGAQLELTPPVDWNQNPFGSRSGVYELHTLQLLDVLLRTYLDDGDERPLGQARDLALDWVAANKRGAAETNGFAWYDMAVGLRAAYLAYLLRACGHAGVLDEEQATTLVEALREHGAFLADEANYARGHNHGLFQDEGLLLLCSYLPFLDESVEWRELAWRRCIETLHETVDWDEGMHLEHSTAYHLAITHYVRRILELPSAEERELGPLLAKLEETAGWLVLPDGSLPELGDTDSGQAVAWAARSAEGKSGLKLLRRSGLAVVREDDSFLAVSAWYHGHAHKHGDELSFVLYQSGHRVICDPGRYGYYEDEPARLYARSNRAHNGLVLGGEPCDWRAGEPYGSGIVAGGVGAGWYAIEGVNPLLRGIEHRRLFLFRPASVLVVVDEVRAEQPCSHARLLHFGPQLEVDERDDSLRLRANGFVGAVSDWSDAPVERSLARGQREPELRGWVFPQDREWVPVWTAELATHGPRLTSAVAIALQDQDVHVRRVNRDADGLRVSLRTGGRSIDVVATAAGDGGIAISEEPAE